MVSNVSSERLSILSIVSGCLSGSHQPVVFNTNQFAWLSILEWTIKEFWGFNVNIHLGNVQANRFR